VADEIHIDATLAEPLPVESQITLEPRVSKPPAEWSLALRVGFRFCFVYFISYCLSNQIIAGLLVNPKFDFDGFGARWPLRPITLWTAAHVFRVTRTLVYTETGSGDRTFDWVQNFFLLVFAAVITALWSASERRRPNYITLHKWFRLFLRFALAGQMLIYGFSKVIPLQMPFPSLQRLLEPYGNFSPMAVLWSSVGASRPYEMFAGSAEVLGGLLLLTPRTTILGALVCLADMIQVFTLNMTYDIPVKLLSFHLILFSLFLLAPEGRRLIRFFFSNQATNPSSQPALFRSPRKNRWALIVQVVFGLYLVGINVYSGIQAWSTYGGGRPKPVLWGIWDVEQMSVDGQIRSPLLGDYGRWRRVIFDFPTFTSFQRIDDSFTGYQSSIDEKEKTLTLSKSNDKNWKATFTYARPAPNQLVLDGSMDGQKVHLQLKLFDRDKLTLISRGFHWISEYPYQR
jgi:hypothetical protein